MWDDPAAWALGAALVLALIVPTLVMMGRRMFGRRKQETTMSDESTAVQTEPDERDPQSRVREQAMTDDAEATEAIRVAKPAVPVEMPTAGHPPNEDERRWAAEGIPGTPAFHEVPIRQTPFARFAPSDPQPLISQHRIDCQECGGRGYMPGINDLLQESVKLLGDQGDEVIRMFYSSLLRAHPQLMTLFPGNPTQGRLRLGPQGRQAARKVAQGLEVARRPVRPGRGGKDEASRSGARLIRPMACWVHPPGRHDPRRHARGVRRSEGGPVHHAAAGRGRQWKPEYTEAWSQAYDYAAAAMLTEQFRSGFAAPRFPRSS
jgi:hypothetical protein